METGTLVILVSLLGFLLTFLGILLWLRHDGEIPEQLDASEWALVIISSAMFPITWLFAVLFVLIPFIFLSLVRERHLKTSNNEN